jgi:hypothetical protein
LPGDELQFPADAVHRHAGSVDGIADAVRQARSAVHEVTMDTQAYGQLCQFLPTLLSPIFALAIEALDDSGEALRETAGNLRAVVSSTTTTDGSAGRHVTAAGRTPGPLLDLPL